MRIAVLGGGPGGLLAALLAKRGDPAREVTVFERNRAGDTFGFGVVFSDATLDGIDAADPVLRRALTEHGVHWDPIEVRLRGERWRFGGNGMAAVARRTLLTLLQQRAEGNQPEHVGQDVPPPRVQEHVAHKLPGLEVRRAQGVQRPNLNQLGHKSRLDQKQKGVCKQQVANGRSQIEHKQYGSPQAGPSLNL